MSSGSWSDRVLGKDNRATGDSDNSMQASESSTSIPVDSPWAFSPRTGPQQGNSDGSNTSAEASHHHALGGRVDSNAAEDGVHHQSPSSVGLHNSSSELNDVFSGLDIGHDTDSSGAMPSPLLGLDVMGSSFGAGSNSSPFSFSKNVTGPSSSSSNNNNNGPSAVPSGPATATPPPISHRTASLWGLSLSAASVTTNDHHALVDFVLRAKENDRAAARQYLLGAFQILGGATDAESTARRPNVHAANSRLNRQHSAPSGSASGSGLKSLTASALLMSTLQQQHQNHINGHATNNNTGGNSVGSNVGSNGNANSNLHPHHHANNTNNSSNTATNDINNNNSGLNNTANPNNNSANNTNTNAGSKAHSSHLVSDTNSNASASTPSSKSNDNGLANERAFNAFLNDETDAKPSTLVLLVPGSKTVVGHIIGKSGSWISHLERTSNVSVSVAKPSQMPLGSSERRITITGTVANCVHAQQKLVRRVHEKLLEEGVKQEFIKMVIPFVIVPHLIGKNGASIKRFQDLSSARIQIDQDSPIVPGSVGRAVTIQGSQHARSLAAYLILRHLSEFRLAKEWRGGRPPEYSAGALADMQAQFDLKMQLMENSPSHAAMSPNNAASPNNYATSAPAGGVPSPSATPDMYVQVNQFSPAPQMTSHDTSGNHMYYGHPQAPENHGVSMYPNSYHDSLHQPYHMQQPEHHPFMHQTHQPPANSHLHAASRMY